jgi:hypothetical protein
VGPCVAFAGVTTRRQSCVAARRSRDAAHITDESTVGRPTLNVLGALWQYRRGLSVSRFRLYARRFSSSSRDAAVSSSPGTCSRLRHYQALLRRLGDRCGTDRAERCSRALACCCAFTSAGSAAPALTRRRMLWFSSPALLCRRAHPLGSCRWTIARQCAAAETACSK